MASSRDQSRLGDIERELTRFVRRSRATSTSMAADVHPEVELLTAVALLMRTVRTFAANSSDRRAPRSASSPARPAPQPQRSTRSRLSRHRLSRDYAGVC